MLRIGQVESSATADGRYTDGSVAGGIAATRLRAAAFNAIQEELANIVESAGMVLSPDDMTQVLTALKKQFLSRTNPFADIKSDGTAAVATALSNLGLGAGAPPIGIPFYWPLAAMPNTVMPEWSDMVFLKPNGISFSAVMYPKLALVWPSLFIPEMRAEFIRIFDDGRGINPLQKLLDYADSRTLVHTHEMPTGRMAVAVDSTSSTWVAVENDIANPKISTKQQAGGAGETAPRSIAFYCLVRAK